jgi:hypothetical protein
LNLIVVVLALYYYRARSASLPKNKGSVRKERRIGISASGMEIKRSENKFSQFFFFYVSKNSFPHSLH